MKFKARRRYKKRGNSLCKRQVLRKEAQKSSKYAQHIPYGVSQIVRHSRCRGA